MDKEENLENQEADEADQDEWLPAVGITPGTQQWTHKDRQNSIAEEFLDAVNKQSLRVCVQTSIWCMLC